MFECSDGGVMQNCFAICTKAVFKPKHQFWAVCKYLDADAVHMASADLSFPFDVELVARTCKVSDAGRKLDVRTLNEFAHTLTSSGTVWSAVELHYHIPPGDTLRISRVTSKSAQSILLSGPDVKKAKKIAEPKDDVLEALRKRPRLDALVAGQRAASSAGSSSSMPNRDLLAPMAIMDGMVDHECFDEGDGYPDQNMLEEVFDFVFEDPEPPSASSSSSSSISGALPEPAIAPPFDEDDAPPPLPPGHDIDGPSASGYFCRAGRSIGRLTAVAMHIRIAAFLLHWLKCRKLPSSKHG
jgi:hypothetical protein